MVTPRPRLRLAALVTASCLVALAGCGVDLADDTGLGPAPTTTEVTTPDGETTTTTEDPSTTTPPTRPDDLSVEDLEAALPEAKDVPTEYGSDPREDDDPIAGNSYEEAMEDACPDLADALAALSAGSSDDDDVVGRKFFSTRNLSELEVSLSLDAGDVDEDTVDDYLTAVDDCDGFSYTLDGASVDVIPSGDTADIGELAFTYDQAVRVTQGSDSVLISSSSTVVLRIGVLITATATARPDRDGETGEVDRQAALDVAATVDTKVAELGD